MKLQELQEKEMKELWKIIGNPSQKTLRIENIGHNYKIK
jgi:hypothetical protein